MQRQHFTCNRCKKEELIQGTFYTAPANWRWLKVTTGDIRYGDPVEWMLHFCPECAEQLRIPQLDRDRPEQTNTEILVNALEEIARGVIEEAQ